MDENHLSHMQSCIYKPVTIITNAFMITFKFDFRKALSKNSSTPTFDIDAAITVFNWLSTTMAMMVGNFTLALISSKFIFQTLCRCCVEAVDKIRAMELLRLLVNNIWSGPYKV